MERSGNPGNIMERSGNPGKLIERTGNPGYLIGKPIIPVVNTTVQVCRIEKSF